MEFEQEVLWTGLCLQETHWTLCPAAAQSGEGVAEYQLQGHSFELGLQS